MITRINQMASANPANKATRAYISNEEFSPNSTPVDQLLDPNAPHNQTPAGATADDNYRFSVGKLPAWAKKQVEGGQQQTGADAAEGQQGQNKAEQAADFPKGLCCTYPS
jgi:hypothetical protein